MHVTHILTQGRIGCCWVTRYRAEAIIDGSWSSLGEFTGNIDDKNTQTNTIKCITTGIRVYPLEYHHYIDLRMDIMVAEVTGADLGIDTISAEPVVNDSQNN